MSASPINQCDKAISLRRERQSALSCPALNPKLLEYLPWHLSEHRVILAGLDPELQSRRAVSPTANRRPIFIHILVLCNLLHQLPQAQRHIAHESCVFNLSSHALPHNDQCPASLESGESQVFFMILIRTWKPTKPHGLPLKPSERRRSAECILGPQDARPVHLMMHAWRLSCMLGNSLCPMRS